MKAAVMKIEGKRAVVMLEDGSFKYLKNENYSVGEELEISMDTDTSDGSGFDRVLTFARKNMPVVAAAAAFVIMLSGGLKIAGSYENSVVTLDINPSLKYSLNVFDKVIDMDSYNDDGAEIVSAVGREIRGQSLECAVKNTLDELDRTGYVGEETAVVVTLNSKTRSEDALETQVIGSVGKWNNEKSDEGESKSVNLETVRVTPQMADSAEDKNVSPGKIYIVGKLKEQVLEEASFDEDEWLDKSVKEIEEATDSLSDGTGAGTISGNKRSSSSNIVTASKNRSDGTSKKTGSEPASDETKPAEGTQVIASSGTGKKKKKVSANATSANGAETVASTEGEGGGTSLSQDAAVAPASVSSDQVVTDPVTGETPGLELPTISAEPVTEDAVQPVETETVTVDPLATQMVDRPETDSSYLDVPVDMGAMCDSVPLEDRMPD